MLTTIAVWSKMTDVQKKLYIEYGCHDGASYIIDSSHSDIRFFIAEESAQRKVIDKAGERTTIEDRAPLVASFDKKTGQLVLTPSVLGGFGLPRSKEGRRKALAKIVKYSREHALVLNDVAIQLSGPATLVAAFLASDAKKFRASAIRWCTQHNTTLEVLRKVG